MEYSELCEKCGNLKYCTKGQNKDLPEFGHIKPSCYIEENNNDTE